ncbi:homogentisate 1,2-dioxygenase [Kyrpidia spormannii]|uniref:Homogentisate 1,2-dioxygenase n=2 Tax=Kyrpidia spormannii TaxID=2055160 RepID=A0A2K8N6E7_9BACL|nr:MULTISPECIES: homogentisate 1,2-dioxygenase [Kyrpidia]ATY84908.1 homogentisate 1,2-dioxygenase [Kyrpidia spormannii]MCL6574634.1 homogentisate 1,2-dioxygenase [Kyrpidia sp.]CAB3392242.1 putative enzyme [Kyrpidia spormannii]CAB3393164.1 putative enzyme [Kyrpidia spormannii]
MPFYHKLGIVPKKRHIQFRNPKGGLYLEEVFGTQGFSGIQSILYHLHTPSAARDYEMIGQVPMDEEGSDQPGHHRHFRTSALKPSGDPVASRLPLLFNDDVRICLAKPTEPMNYFYRNAEGDELIFVHQGTGVLESVFGELRFGPGDYLVIPVGTTYRLNLGEGDNVHYVIEAKGPIAPPSRYLNQYGQFMEDAPFCERDIRVPDRLVTHDEQRDHEIRIRQKGKIFRAVVPHHPLDVVGWDGYVYPWAFHIEDFEPRVGKIHLPPPVHQTFQGPGFVVCSFVPRLYDFHPEAIPAPYYHSNIDSDEVLYYVHGEFMSRKGIEPGSLTLHPRGVVHGPQPGKIEASIGQRETNELAVMVDTFRPLTVSTHARECEDSGYPFSWLA